MNTRSLPLFILAALVTASASAQPATPSRPKGDAKEAIAWVMSKGGTATVKVRDQVIDLRSGQAVPKGGFDLVRVHVDHNDGTPLPASELTSLTGLPALESLFLRGTAASPDVFDVLRTLPKLHTLEWLADATVKPEQLARFAEVPKLESLRMDASPGMTSAGMAALVTAKPGLTSLEVRATALDDAAVPHLLKLRHLRKLNIAETRITASGIMMLTALPALDYLGISATQMNGGLDWSRFTHLHELSLASSKEFPFLTEALTELTRCRKLETLQIETRDEFSLAQMRAITDLRGLRKLVFYYISTPNSSWPLLATMPALERLLLTEVSCFDDDALMSLTQCRSLKVIEVKKTQLTPEGIAAFRKKRPKVTLTT